MTLQVLVATMNQKNHSLLEKMNINSDAIVGNQCDRNEIEDFDYKGHKVKYLSFSEKGVGLNRNNMLMRASADICLFADDDVRYVSNYQDIIINTFKKIKDADVLIFNLISNNPSRQSSITKKVKRIRFFNCLKYGTYRIAVRTERIKWLNIYFSLLFGGGAKFSCGEDSLFIVDCLRKGCKIYAVPEVIGTVDQTDSSWFTGYNDKYFIDKGILFAAISKRLSLLLCLQFCLRHRKLFVGQKKWFEAMKLLFKGAWSVRAKNNCNLYS